MLAVPFHLQNYEEPESPHGNVLFQRQGLPVKQ